MKTSGADNFAIPSNRQLFLGAMESVLNALPDPVFVKDRQHRWVIFNDAFCEFIGRPRVWLYGKSDYDFAAFAQSPFAEADIFWARDDDVFLSGEPNASLEVHTDSAARRRTIETKKTLLHAPDGTVFLIGVIRDLTELTHAKASIDELNRELERKIEVRTQELTASNKQLEILVHYDQLTGLPNRRFLVQTLERLLPAMSIGVFLIDLDHFKWIDNSQGHHVGEAILIGLAERLRTLKYFSTVSRIGGDQFIAIAEIPLSVVDQNLPLLGHHLREALCEPIAVSGKHIVVSASIGIAASSRADLSATDLIQNADTALYQAKKLGGRQCVIFDSEMGSRAKERIAVEMGLRAAIKAHEIRVALQPIVDARTRLLVGFEALARWHDPVLGDIEPEQFIPIAETSDLIYDFGLTVMARALRMGPHHLQACPFPDRARLAVNVSARQLMRPSFLADIQGLLTQTRFPAAQLELEITESSAMNFSAETLANLDGLRQMNVAIALDDFGTGFSSLTVLHRLPIDGIKIDRGFVAELPGNLRTVALVGAMIRMAHSLDLNVVAEGVERTEQADCLTQLGCNELQGFLLGHPVLPPH